jgi:hypothetical protein
VRGKALKNCEIRKGKGGDKPALIFVYNKLQNKLKLNVKETSGGKPTFLTAQF